MTQYIDKSALVAEIKSRISDIEVSQKAGLIKKRDADKKILLFKSVLSLIDTLEVKEEPVSEDLNEAVNAYIGYPPEVDESSSTYGKRQAFKTGAKWQKENLWKPADGDDLPEIDKKVIALEGIVGPTATDCLCGYRVIFAHRPDPKGYDGKSIVAGEIGHYTPKTYGEGGWSTPYVKYWLDADLPTEIEL